MFARVFLPILIVVFLKRCQKLDNSFYTRNKICTEYIFQNSVVISLTGLVTLVRTGPPPQINYNLKLKQKSPIFLLPPPTYGPHTAGRKTLCLGIE